MILYISHNNIKNFNILSDNELPSTKTKCVQIPSVPNEESEVFLNSINFDRSNENDEIHTIFRNSLTEQPESISEITLEKPNIRYFRIWILILLALFIRYLNLVTDIYDSVIEVDISTLHINKIFVPFFLYEVFDVAFLKSSIKSSSFLTTLLLFINLNVRNINKIVDCINYCIRFFQDLLLYFFTFVVTDFFINIIFER